MEDTQENNYKTGNLEKSNADLWIENEGFLRDDGVLFGYSNAPPDSKLEAIEHYYDSKINPLKIEAGSFELDESKITKLIVDLNSAETDSIAEHEDLGTVYLGRNIIGLLFIIGACFFNFFLIAYDLKSFASGSKAIAVGVYLFGLFMIFAPKSILYEYKNENIQRPRSNIYLYLLEFGTPIVAALFVAYEVISISGVITGIIHFILILLLFITTGKLLLSLLKQVTDDIKAMRKKKAYTRNKKNELTASQMIVENKQQELQSLKNSLDSVLKNKLHTEKQIAKLEMEKESRKELFMSEYNLAKTFAARLNIKPPVAFLKEYNVS